MTALLSVSYGCDISRDPAENTRRHQDMVDTLNARISEDGWPGVKVTRLQSLQGSTFVTIEPGVSALTIDYLRALRKVEPAPMPVSEPEPDREGQQALAL